MSNEELKDPSTSIKDRLKNYAISENIEFNYALRMFAMSQFLHRLSISAYNERFVIKGGMAIYAQNFPLLRTTKDIDFLSLKYKTKDELEKVIKGICKIQTEDGLIFDTSNIKFEEKDSDSENPNFRIKFQATLSSAIIPMVIDIGIGDEIFPDAELKEMPPILKELPRTSVYIYPLESIVSEKLQIMARFGLFDFRFRDFLDIWVIINNTPINGDNLCTAIEKTFSRRTTPLTLHLPIFEREYYEDGYRHTQWKTLINRLRANIEIPEFNTIVTSLQQFVEPIIKAIISQKSFPKK